MVSSATPVAPHWWHSSVLYQIYPLSFKDANGDGLGDLRGIIEKLPYLRELGIGGVWISPFYDAVLQYDYGYGPRDLTAIHPLFGTMADFDELLARARELDIKIIMEWAVTNTSVWSEWFLESRSSRDNPKADWYLWTDHPNNWVSFSGGSAWHYCPERNQYYMGHFFKEHAELNWRNPEVQQAVLAAMEFWIAKGIHGFRLDTVNLYVKDKELRDNPPQEVNLDFLKQNFDADDPIFQSKYLQYLLPDDWKYQHLYDMNQPESLDILRDMRALCDRYSPDFLLLGETDINSDMARQLCNAGMSLGNNFSLTNCRWDARQFGAVLRREQSILDQFLSVTVFSNHDCPRAISAFATDDPCETGLRARVLAALTLTLRGVPMFYYGEEIGQLDAQIPFSELTDPISSRYYYLKRDGHIRDVARSPMAWDASPTAGFTTASHPWLRLSPEHERRNVLSEMEDPNSLLLFYQRLIALRNATPALQTGDFRLLAAGEEGYLAYARGLGEQDYVIALNFTPAPISIDLTRYGFDAATPVFTAGGELSDPGTLRLAGYGIGIVKAQGQAPSCK